MSVENLVFQVPVLPGSTARYSLRAQSRGKQNGKPPIVFLVGGPGESGLRAREFEPFRLVVDELAKTRQVVLWDQRGCGDSEPRLAMAQLRPRQEMWIDQDAAFAMLVDQARRCWTQWGEEFLPESITPRQTAHDLAALADALSAEQVDLLAYSYGTHAAQAALKISPDRIRRVVLCGFEGPDQTYKLPSQIEPAFGVSDLRSKLISAIEELSQRPRVVKLDGVGETAFGAFGLKWMLGGWVGISGLHAKIAPLMDEIVSSPSTALLERAVNGFWRALQGRPAAYYLNDAASGASAERLARIETETSDYALGSCANFPFPEIRQAWRQSELDDEFRRPVECAHSILVLLGERDVFTPPGNAKSSLGGLKNAEVRIVPNAFHDELLSFDDAPQIVSQFLNA